MDKVSDQTLSNIFTSLMELAYVKETISESLSYRIAEICVKVSVDK